MDGRFLQAVHGWCHSMDAIRKSIVTLCWRRAMNGLQYGEGSCIGGPFQCRQKGLFRVILSGDGKCLLAVVRINGSGELLRDAGFPHAKKGSMVEGVQGDRRGNCTGVLELCKCADRWIRAVSTC